MNAIKRTFAAAMGLSLLTVAGTASADSNAMDGMANHHGMKGHGGMYGIKGHGSKHVGGSSVSGLADMLDAYDTDADGSLSQDEILGARAEQLKTFDADQDGTLSIDEYEALWLDAMRERMVDRFQQHDDDGDGQVTVEEFNEDFQRFIERRDRNGDGVLNSDD
ncbi:EF-hand domain-containing protein [Aliiruegeria sabulilitoris]|uniref:EF-hand domain-containing protein n=1 Tax=Aliiruegeria sabulilitoris TaxID=1510458 RepID=UPI000832300B|nr:EF-hand domain-containing protein [Aliiruegeria sabulilitoris]NDR55890.1 hypothetical protein [Pseudoruegeria sp. M32A2M]